MASFFSSTGFTGQASVVSKASRAELLQFREVIVASFFSFEGCMWRASLAPRADFGRIL